MKPVTRRLPLDMQENVGAAGLDLSGVLPEIEQLIPLGPTFAPAEQSS